MAENKTEIIQVRFTPKQREALQEVADASGFKLSEWIRIAAVRAAKAAIGAARG